RSFDLRLSVAREGQEVRGRVERYQPLAGPEGPVDQVRPRDAVLNFAEFGGDPSYLGPWTAEEITPYFSTQFEPIDRDELHWWMGRLGVTLRDLLTDSAVRIWLGRALDVRYFAIGKIERDAGLTVTAYLLDSEQGFLASGARVDVRDRHELKLRLAELARLTQMSPPERIQMEKN